MTWVVNSSRSYSVFNVCRWSRCLTNLQDMTLLIEGVDNLGGWSTYASKQRFLDSELKNADLSSPLVGPAGFDRSSPLFSCYFASRLRKKRRKDGRSVRVSVSRHIMACLNFGLGGLRNAFVAVGTLVDPAPPHRSVRAELLHTAPTSDTWRRSAIASRTPSKSLNSLFRLCVRGAVACPMFSLAGRLPSLPSAGGFPPSFGHFVGTTQPSDSPPTCMLDFWHKAFSNRPVTLSTTGVDGVSRFSRVEFPCMPGVSDCAESAGCSR